MSTVIDFEAERGRRDVPDTEHVTYDDEGTPLYRYTCEFRMDDGQLGEIDLWAYDFDHAELTVAAMRNSLMVVGQVMARGEA